MVLSGETSNLACNVKMKRENCQENSVIQKSKNKLLSKITHILARLECGGTNDEENNHICNIVYRITNETNALFVHASLIPLPVRQY